MAWQKGQSGNPAGRKSSSRQELGESFLRVLKADWEANGAITVSQMREKDPVAYVKCVAALLPDQLEVDVGSGVVELLAAVNDARRKRSAPTTPDGVEPSGTSAVCH